jgi:hypothetical protein
LPGKNRGTAGRIGEIGLGRTGVEGFRNPTFKYETLLSKKRGA